MFSSVGMSAQSIANRGLTHHQDSSTLPRSKAETVMPVPVSVKAPEAVLTPSGSSEFVLSGGWMLADNDCVLGARQSVFSHEYNLEGWYNATVPGTVLTTLVDMNVYPDPYFGLNNLAIPDTLCRKDWWYRLQFDAPDTSAGRQAWLILNGINYAADIWLNGTRVGDIKGAFMRGQFNVTDILRKNDNVLAVHILPPPNPGIPHEQSPSAGNGMNGGQLCLDGPTFISSEGWDWVPGIRDRNIGNATLAYLDSISDVEYIGLADTRDLEDGNFQAVVIYNVIDSAGNKSERNARVITSGDGSEILAWEDVDSNVLSDTKHKISDKMEEKGINLDGNLIDALIELKKQTR